MTSRRPPGDTSGHAGHRGRAGAGPTGRAGPALLLAGLALAACAAPAPAPAPADAGTAGPTRADPVTACTNQLVYWAGEQLRGADDGGDYQHHGLTSEQNDALSVIVDGARARGAALPADQVPRDARAACERIVRENPSGF